MPDPGLLNQPIVIERQDVQSEFGDKFTWVQVASTYGHIQPVSGREMSTQSGFSSEANYVVTIRFRQGIDAHQRIRFTNRQVEYIFLILYITRTELPTPEWLELTCKEQQL